MSVLMYSEYIKDFIYFNCGERYENVIEHLSSFNFTAAYKLCLSNKSDDQSCFNISRFFNIPQVLQDCMKKEKVKGFMKVIVASTVTEGISFL